MQYFILLLWHLKSLSIHLPAQELDVVLGLTHCFAFFYLQATHPGTQTYAHKMIFQYWKAGSDHFLMYFISIYFTREVIKNNSYLWLTLKQGKHLQSKWFAHKTRLWHSCLSIFLPLTLFLPKGCFNPVIGHNEQTCMCQTLLLTSAYCLSQRVDLTAIVGADSYGLCLCIAQVVLLIFFINPQNGAYSLIYGEWLGLIHVSAQSVG